MGTKERISRHKDSVRHNILFAALEISKEHGWHSVSMRKIADAIEYSPPMIYEHFDSKEDLLIEIAKEGFVLLSHRLTESMGFHTEPRLQLESMWVAYWNFAFAESSLYQIMFGVEFTCCDFRRTLPEAQSPPALFIKVLQQILGADTGSAETVQKHYYAFWSALHGLISIKLIHRDTPADLTELVLKEAIRTMNLMLNEATAVGKTGILNK